MKYLFMMLVVGICVIIWFIFFYAAPIITISNDLEEPITDVTVHAEKDYPIDEILSHKSKSVRVHPNGETGLDISYSFRGKTLHKHLVHLYSSMSGYRYYTSISE